MASFTMTTFLCVALLIGINLVSGASTSFCQGTCPSGWHSNNGRCFKYVATKTHWADAERKCQNLGGHLPSVHSQEEDQFLKTLFKSLTNRDDPFWLGLSDSEMHQFYSVETGRRVIFAHQHHFLLKRAIMVSFSMSAFLCGVVFSGIALVPQVAAMELCQGGCPAGWKSVSGRCFKYIPGSKDWATAEKTCRDNGGTLASVHSAEEHEAVKQAYRALSGRDDSFWVGLSDCQKEGLWLWSDGSVFTFQKWNPGQPDNWHNDEDCVHTNVGGPKDWNDLSCASSQPFLCQTLM
ncbi:hypothetical protein AGOR_G00042600 [Albula goreensis]|uniref:C-type lectin domain-containing protein n=1 Tax=Albula goreensis TaxID=1534307 RepID=A0A8T3DYS4_9TELE|nr:hypothetical protein AGOR_G00042600 [Albula goreensis]